MKEIHKIGTLYYNEKGKRHRVDGPAIEYQNGDREYFFNGKHHRVDGPAIDYEDYKEWWINGEEYSEENFNKYVKMANESTLMDQFRDKFQFIY